MERAKLSRFLPSKSDKNKNQIFSNITHEFSLHCEFISKLESCLRKTL